MTYVLRSASTYRGKPLWFKQMTAIGPMTTEKIEERAVFYTEEAARQCPAMFHALSFFEVESVGMPDVVVNPVLLNPSLHYTEMLERAELEKENQRLRAALELTEEMVDRASQWLDMFVAAIDAPSDNLVVRDCREEAESFLCAALGIASEEAAS